MTEDAGRLFGALIGRMRGGETPDVFMGALQVSGAAVRGRSCGGCTACCTQVPVALPDEQKPANTRCRHLGGKGCRVYANRPAPCVAWSCRWLFDTDTAELRRPDHSGVVIDCTPDTVLRNGEPVGVIQVWCDPKRRDAHRDPALRRYLAAVCKKADLWVIVRWTSAEGLILIPPHVVAEGVWIEHESAYKTESEMEDALAALGRGGGGRFAPGVAP